MKKNGPHMPSWPKWESENTFTDSEIESIKHQFSSRTTSDDSRVKKIPEFTELQMKQMKEILEYLAVKEATVYPSKMRSIEPKCPNICCTRLTKLFGTFCVNPKTVCIDTVCCLCVSASDPQPDKMTWVRKEVFDKMNEIRRDTNRNTMFLLGLAPAITIAVPNIPTDLTSGFTNVLMQIGINLLLLYSAGVQTFLLVDYGSGELQSCVVDMQGYERLSRYLYEEWEKADGKEKIKLAEQVLLIHRNLPKLKEGMTNIGIRPAFVSSILAPFAGTIHKIVMEIKSSIGKHE